MPDNWDDSNKWEEYFASLASDDYWFKVATTSPGSFSFDRLGTLMSDLHRRKLNTIWFPGCGFSPLPRAFASFGFVVYATDIAPSAIAYQNNNESIVRELIVDVTVQHDYEKHGYLTTQIHDFRSPFGDRNVDAIFNIKSIQGLSPSSMQSAIRSHFAALRPGGIAFFDTINVQGERRRLLEDALADAGFYVPLYKLNQWYRKALADTGIPHVFILGTPVIPQTDDYPHKHDSPEYNRDRDILRAMTADYRSRIDAEYNKEQQLVNERTKRAHVIYSTG